jgi:hypothetical protein
MSNGRKRGRPPAGDVPARSWPAVTCRFSPKVWEVIGRIAEAECMSPTAVVTKLALDQIEDAYFNKARAVMAKRPKA